jgi:hypothetical protein
MWKWAVAWGLRKMGPAWRKAVKGGPAPQEMGKSVLSKGRDNMSKDEEDPASRT